MTTDNLRHEVPDVGTRVVFFDGYDGICDAGTEATVSTVYEGIIECRFDDGRTFTFLAQYGKKMCDPYDMPDLSYSEYAAVEMWLWVKEATS